MKKILPSNFKSFSFHINTNSIFNFFSSLFPCLSSKILINDQPITHLLPHSFNNNDLHLITYSIMPLPGVKHPNFEHVSKTHYLVTNFSNQHQCAIIHVGQIYQYMPSTIIFVLTKRTQMATLESLSVLPISYYYITVLHLRAKNRNSHMGLDDRDGFFLVFWFGGQVFFVHPWHKQQQRHGCCIYSSRYPSAFSHYTSAVWTRQSQNF